MVINQQELDRVFAALSDATRRDMLAQLSAGERNIGSLAERYRISQPAVSKHVRVLERAGLVTSYRRGRQSFLRVNTEPMDQARGWISYYTQFWKRQFNAVDEYLRRGETGEREDGT
ncbi:MAG: metalloregulator ArsR/SmtB family transcription factor [bacterium]